MSPTIRTIYVLMLSGKFPRFFMQAERMLADLGKDSLEPVHVARWLLEIERMENGSQS